MNNVDFNNNKLIKDIKRQIKVLLEEPEDTQSVELFRLALEQVLEHIEDNEH